MDATYPYSKEVRSMLAKKTAKNQLTLPKEIANKFPGVDLFDATVEDNRIVLVPVKVTPITASLETIREKMEKLGITEDDVTNAIAWTRKKKL
jgi:carbon monoxide dehydrogenase subunit G